MAHVHAAEGHHHHIIPRSILLKVFGGLVFLTIVTVLTAQIDLGAFNVPLALAIALAKASLVVTFFMALKYDKRVNMLVFTVGILFVIVFLVFTLFDVAYRGDLGNVSAETITDMMREQENLTAQEPGPPTEATAPGDADGGVAADSAAVDTTGAAPAGAAVDTTVAPAGGQ